MHAEIVDNCTACEDTVMDILYFAGISNGNCYSSHVDLGGEYLVHTAS